MIILFLFFGEIASQESDTILYFSEDIVNEITIVNSLLKTYTLNVKAYDVSPLFRKDLPRSIDFLYLVKGENKEGEVSLFLAGEKNNKIITFSKLKYNGEIFNAAKAWIVRHKDSVEIETEYPFSAATYSITYIWDKKNITFKYITDDNIDYSMDMLDKADSLLREGDIKGAVDAFWDISYPQHYYDSYEMAAKFLIAGHKQALKVYKEKKDAEKALEVMKTSFDPMLNLSEDAYIPVFNSKKEFEDYGFSEFLKFNEYVVILNDFGFFLEQAGQLDEAVDIFSAVLKLSPERVVAYLNMGDALWKKGEKNRAKYYYTEYIKMMKDMNKENVIPQRVKKRAAW